MTQETPETQHPKPWGKILGSAAVAFLAIGIGVKGCNQDGTPYLADTTATTPIPHEVEIGLTASPSTFTEGELETIELGAVYDGVECSKVEWLADGPGAPTITNAGPRGATLRVSNVTVAADAALTVRFVGQRPGQVLRGSIEIGVKNVPSPPTTPPPPPLLSFTTPIVLSQEASEVPGGADPGQEAAKTKLVSLTQTPGAAHDGRLITVYADANETGAEVWESKGGQHPPRDIFVRTSDDAGATWSNPVNISRTADKYSASTDWSGDGNATPYWGDSSKPNIFNQGDDVVVTWVDKYAPEASWTWGANGQSTIQGSVLYPDPAVSAAQRQVPFACVYAAVSTDGGATWTRGAVDPPLQLTYGRRDAIQDLNRGAGGKWVITWQEDPAGLQTGEAEGPGEGSSGAKATKGTDVWYTYTTDIAAIATSLVANRRPLTNHSRYDTTGTNGFPTVGAPGAEEKHAATRANLHIVKDGSTFKAIVAYEETKGLGDVDVGKTIQYHCFPFAAPITSGTSAELTGDPGTLLSDPRENGRRVRFVRQGPDGTRPALAIFWKQGLETQGAPSDIMLKVSTSLDPAAVAAARTVNLSSNTPSAIATNLDDATSRFPVEDAQAHRAILRGRSLLIGYSYSSNGPLAPSSDQANYDFWLRISEDGGQTWSTPRNLTRLPLSLTCKEPRLIQTAVSVGGQNDDAVLVAWGTETNVHEGVETAQQVDLWVTRSLDRGKTFETPTRFAKSDAEEYESQLRLSADGSTVFAVWNSTSTVTDGYFSKGTAARTP